MKELIEKYRNDFYQSQLEVCEALNGLSASLYDKDPDAAVLVYRKALALELQKDFSEETKQYLNTYGRTSLDGEVWARPSNSMGWQQATLHTTLNLASLLTDGDEKSKLLERAVNTKVAALSQVKGQVDKAYEKLRSSKRHIELIIDNNSRSTHGTWYSRSLQFLQRIGKLDSILQKLR
jgi:hypothetical protein